MAIYYNLYVQGQFEIGSSIELFLTEHKIGYKKKLTHSNETYDTFDECGFFTTISVEENQHFEYVMDGVNIEHEWGKCTAISFRLNKFFDYNKSVFYISEIAGFLLKRFDADVILLADNEILVFKRVDNSVTISSTNDTFSSMLTKQS